MDIVERLREKAEQKSINLWFLKRRIETEAADEIERLRSALKRIAQHDLQAWALDALHPDTRIKKDTK